MLIKELIKELQKYEKEYPDHDIFTRGERLVERVEVCQNGVELVLGNLRGVPDRAPDATVFHRTSRRTRRA